MAETSSVGYVGTVIAATGLTSRQLAARAIGAAAAAAVPLLLLLPYASFTVASPTTFVLGTQTATGWQILNGSDIVMTVCSVAVVACVGLDLFASPGRWLGPATALACIDLGLAWPDLLTTPLSWAAGAYLVLLVAIAECASLVVAFRGPPARAVAPWPTSRSPAGT